MITSDDLKPLRSASDDYAETERLKSKFRDLKLRRKPFHLTGEDFEEVLTWKLRTQYGRQRRLREGNTDSLIQGITRLALNIEHEDSDYELELRIGVLCALRGVAVPVASAVLALTSPDDYAVIDFRAWRQIFPDKPLILNVTGYKKYLNAIRPLARELNWPVQEVDLAIWEYDRRRDGRT